MENVELGQVVTPNSMVATLVATDEFLVQVGLPLRTLDWLQIPGSKAEILLERGGDSSPLRREGELVRLLGDLEPQGRLARVQVKVDDPLDLTKSPKERRPLLLGSYVQVRIEGPTLENVIKLPRTALREGSRVWIVDAESRLEIREVDILYRTQRLGGPARWRGGRGSC